MPHESVNKIGKRLLSPFQALWNFSNCIEGFTGRPSDIANIPTKPITIGFKIWLPLTEEGSLGCRGRQGPHELRTKGVLKRLGLWC